MGLAPFSGFWLALYVEGFDAPGGEPALYTAAGTMSGPAGVVIPRDFNTNYRRGEADFATADGEMRATAQVDGGVGQIAATARPGPATGLSAAGVEHRLGMGHDGDLILYTLTYSYNYTAATLTDLRFDLPPGHPLALLASLTPSWVVCQTDMAVTFGVPGPARGNLLANQPNTPVLDLLSHIGRPVAIVEAGGRILYLNAEAEDILGRDPARTRRLPPEIRALVPASLATPDTRSGIKRTTLLTLPSGQQILATAFPISLRLSDAPALMVLLNDPRHPGPTDPEPLLRLMGLTPSEAALAALIGAGATPSEAASARGITQSTARSTLKLIFAKLNLRRQADLAQIVTRLQMG